MNPFINAKRTLLCALLAFSVAAPALASASPATVRVLDRNNEAWFARVKLIERAKKTLVVQYFLVGNDIFATSFLGMLMQKRLMEGVDVTLMVDGKGSFKHTLFNRKYLRTLANAGVHVRVFNDSLAGPMNHDKILIADEQTTILGGRNIYSGQFLADNEPGYLYHDTDVLIDSKDAARSALAAFQSEYRMPVSTPIYADPSFDDAATRRELREAAWKMLVYLEDPAKSKPLSEELKSIHSLDGYPGFRLFQNSLPSNVEVFDNEAAMPGRGKRLHALSDRLVSLIDEAKHAILVTSPYIQVPAKIKKALIRASTERNVKITLYTNSPLSSNMPNYNAILVGQWEQLLRDVPTMRLFVKKKDPVMHSKLLMVDGESVMISSYNLDRMSEYANSEIGVELRDPSVASQVGKIFSDRIDSESVELGLKPYRGLEQLGIGDFKLGFYGLLDKIL